MPQPSEHPEQTTQTDLLYGLTAGSGSDLAVLEVQAGPPQSSTLPITGGASAASDSCGLSGSSASGAYAYNSGSDAIRAQAATRADSTLHKLARGLRGGSRSRLGARWSYPDGWIPPERLASQRAQQYQVEPRVVRSTWARRLSRIAWGSTGWAASLMMHLVVFGALIWLTVAPQEKDWRRYVSAIRGELLPQLEKTDPPQEVTLPAVVDALTPEPVTMEIALIDPAETERGAWEGPWSEAPTLARHVPVRPTGDVAQLFGQLGQGSTQRGDATGGAKFFGLDARGNKFVFVVDCSLSMQGEKWLLATQELSAAFERLQPEQLFYIVLFDGGVHRMFNQDESQATLYPATDENKQRVRQWLASARLGHETRPYLSLKTALELKPDAVFLLSDGDFNDPTMAYLKSVNSPTDERGRPRPQIAIHTVSFQNRGSDALRKMRQIARESGGRHVLITPK